MKKLVFLICTATVLFACQTVDPEMEKEAVKTTLNEFYTSMEDFNYDALRSLCTEDFSLFETGFDYNDIDGFIAAVKSMEGATLKVDLDFEKTDVNGKMALAVLIFSADIEIGGNKMNIKAYENYVLKKVDNKWLIYYIQSTHLPDPDNKNLASLHLLKVSDEMTIETFQNAIDKFNQAISEMGFWECGYTVMQVVPGSNQEFNYFVKGTWKNQETYDAIHENEAWKNLADNLPPEVKKFFDGQIYLKVVDL